MFYDILNGTQELLTGEEYQDPTLYQEVKDCAEQLVPNLLYDSLTGQWVGMLHYAASNGSADDYWHPCNDNSGYHVRTSNVFLCPFLNLPIDQLLEMA